MSERARVRVELEVIDGDMSVSKAAELEDDVESYQNGVFDMFQILWAEVERDRKAGDEPADKES